MKNHRFKHNEFLESKYKLKQLDTLDHLVLTVQNIDVTCAFYQQVEITNALKADAE